MAASSQGNMDLLLSLRWHYQGVALWRAGEQFNYPGIYLSIKLGRWVRQWRIWS